MDKQTKMKFNVLAIICIIVFSFVLAPKVLQNDTYYTIAIGEHIAEKGLDNEDPFAWTDLKYTYPHWLYDLSLFKVYDMWRNDRNIYMYRSFKLCFRSHFVYNCN